jgi:hypothetical protein
VTLNSSGPATLGNLTRLGTGAVGATTAALNASNGFVVNFGDAVIGYGAMNSTNAPAKAAVINGTVQGDSPAQPITLSGYIKGVGTFNNVVFTGTFAPGFSPATLSAGSITYAGKLQAELAGTSAGQFDAIHHAGTASLGGTLDISLLNGFVPTYGADFPIITAASVVGRFNAVTGFQIDPNHYFALVYSSDKLELTVALPGDADLNGSVTFVDFIALANNFGQPNAGWQGADFNNDNVTSFADFIILANNFGATTFGNQLIATPDEGAALNAFAAANSVPEPATLALLALAAATLLSRPRRHGTPRRLH